MAQPPRKTPPPSDNVVNFKKLQREAAQKKASGPGPGGGKPSGPPDPRAWLKRLEGREGWVGLAVIVVIAVVIVLWRRLG